ncbi:solute carrier family 2, facilitated glucose transporter member 10 isoform X4 [Hydra vulgaris]|uniref:Solute carrier family 2, facilitated glucose transporter member 10 isoform X4 n=1 Tax=Hydra vulgaris TaxID=6087 RepID=A0ABM4D852_HYDVU
MEEDTMFLLNKDKKDSFDESDVRCLLVSKTSCKKSFKRYNLLILLASFIASLGGILFGYDIGIISGAMLQLRVEFNLSCLQQEMVVSSLLLGGLIGSLTGGFLLDRFGRKIVIIMNAFFYIIGGLTLTFSGSYSILLIGRFIVGFAVALSAVSDCVYISEIAPMKRRGSLVSLNEFGITIGILLAYLTSFLLITKKDGWRYMFGISCLPAALQAFVMFFLPESPRWLLINGQEKKAQIVITKLWPNCNLANELNNLNKSLECEQNYKFMDLFSSKENLCMRMIIGCGVIFFQQLSGQPTIIYYAPSLFQSLGFSSHVSSSLVTVGLGIVKVVFTFVSLCFIDKLGRRKLLLLGAIIMTLSVITLSVVTEPFQNVKIQKSCGNDQVLTIKKTCFNKSINFHQNFSSLVNQSKLDDSKRILIQDYLNCKNTNFVSNYPVAIRYTCLFALMLFVIGYAVGYGPVTWLLLTEIFPTGIKGRAAAVATSLNWGTNIILSMAFLDMIDKLGPFYIFLMYALIGVVSIIFIYHIVPETKFKSLESISFELSKSFINCSERKMLLVESEHNVTKKEISDNTEFAQETV